MDRLQQLIARIEKARLSVDRHRIVRIVAVSKTVQSQSITSLYELGQRAFGENRVQDLAQKCTELQSYPIEWHFIGNLQANKINQLLRLKPFLVHSLHSLALAQEIKLRLERENQNLRMLLQVNISQEPSKSGFPPQEAYDAYLQILEQCPQIKLVGLMAMGPNTTDQSIIKQNFEAAYQIYERLQPYGANILSMGMSNDFELAIACGSNCVRIGSALFDA